MRIWNGFDRNMTPEGLEKQQRERYERWLERNHRAAQESMSGNPE